MLQVPQLVVGQVPQILPMPAIELDPPSALLEKAAKVENSFLAAIWQLGQKAASSA